MPRRAKIVTPAVLEQMRRWIEEGRTAEEISTRIGCTLGTLRVRCRKRGSAYGGPDPAPQRKRPRPVRMSVTLPRTILSIIQTQAERKGMTDEMLVASLLGKIAEDNLFAAVLDEEAASVGGLVIFVGVSKRFPVV